MNALFLTLNVNNWLANSRHAHILHVFEQACNLINEGGEVMSIVTSEIGNGPFNLVIEDDILFSDRFDAQSPISIDTNQLHVGDLTIDTEGAKLWDSMPDWKLLHANKGKILGQLRSLPKVNYQPLPNMLISSFSSALVALNNSPVLTATSQLAGLGQGLTPAGDDFMMGAIYAAWIIHPPEVVRVLAEEITGIAAPLTTSLSAAWLRSCGRGEAGILWHDFFDALISTNQTRIQNSITNILGVGETSGADALAGFISVLTYSSQLTSPKAN